MKIIARDYRYYADLSGKRFFIWIWGIMTYIITLYVFQITFDLKGISIENIDPLLYLIIQIWSYMGVFIVCFWIFKRERIGNYYYFRKE